MSRSGYSFPPSPSESDSDYDGEQDSYEVFWETKSILEPSAKASGPVVARSIGSGSVKNTVTPQKPARGTAEKRSTTAAALPSPSSASVANGSGNQVARAPSRLVKRRRRPQSSSTADVAAGGADSSQGVDASTMRLVSQLAARFTQRQQQQQQQQHEAGSVQAKATRRSNTASCKSHAAAVKQQQNPAAVTTPAPAAPPTPVTRSRSAAAGALARSDSTHSVFASLAKAVDQPPPCLGFSASKPSAAEAGTSLSNGTKLKAIAAVASTTQAGVTLPIKPAPPLDNAGKEEDEFDSYVLDDDIFELALSQLDESKILPTSSQSGGLKAAAAGRTSARAPVPPVVAKPTEKSKVKASDPPAVRQVVPAVKAPASRTLAQAKQPPKPPIAKPTVVKSTAKVVNRPVLQLRQSSVCFGAGAVLDEQERVQLEQQAAATLEGLDMGTWSDEDF